MRNLKQTKARRRMQRRETRAEYAKFRAWRKNVARMENDIAGELKCALALCFPFLQPVDVTFTHSGGPRLKKRGLEFSVRDVDDTVREVIDETLVSSDNLYMLERYLAKHPAPEEKETTACHSF